jgi:hypothetical protein
MDTLRARTLAFVAIACLLITEPNTVLSQSITGDILGTVQDSSGAVVPGATITLSAVDTGATQTSTTDSGGNYLFAQLKPGRYSVAVSKEGFQTRTISQVELLVGQRPRVDITLAVGAVAQSVEVSAGGVQLLETQTSTMGQVIQEKPVQELPLNGRNFMQLAVLSPGVAPVGTGVSPATGWVGQSNVTTSVAGLRESNESFLVDGIESRNARFGSVGLRPSPEAIQEFKMQTSDFSAEFGRSSAIINTTLRSGSNTLHGSAYEFIRNSSLDANDFFLNLASASKPQFQQNNFGASLGGPVALPHLYHGHDKTFFFINYEGLRSRQGISGTALVPSRAQLAGNLADDSTGTGLYPTSSPFCQANQGSAKCVNVTDPTTGLPFAGNIIPTGMLDPTAQKWLGFIPTPNVAVTPGQAQPPSFDYTTSPKDRNDMNQFNIRLDHSISSKDQLFGSYSFEDRPHIAPDPMPLRGVRYPLRNQLLTVTETHTFSPTIVNEARFGYNRTKTFLVSLGALGANYAADIFGFTNTSSNPFDFGVPNASISGGFSTVGSAAESIGALDEDYQLVDNLSIVRSNHNVKLGVNFIHEKFFQITDFSGIPSFSFDGRFTGAGLGDFLLGDPYQAITSVGDSSQNLRANWWSGYLQDDWRVRPSLTLNLGVRYEHAQTPYDITDKTQWFDPAVKQVVTSRSGGVRNGIVDPNWHNVAPRLGFAYSPSYARNTVFRGSYGIFYATDNWNELQFLVIGPDFFSSQTLNSDPTSPTLSLRQLFPSGALGGGTLNPFSVDKRNRTPYVQEWSFDLQHTFAKDWLVDLGYIGNVGQKLPQRRNQNIASPDPTGLIPITDREPYPDLSWILLTYNGGWSSYNGMTLRAEKRLSSGFYLLGAYTYSHAIDLGGTDEFSASSALFKVLDKGNSTFDVRHRVVLSYLYELPFGPGKHFLSGTSGVLGRLIGGWQFNGITTFSTGQHQTAGLPVDWPNLGAFSQSRPDQIGNPYPSDQNYNNWLDINAFVVPGCPSFTTETIGTRLVCGDGSPGTHVQGTAARNSLENPGINNWDFSVTKATRINERTNLQFRAEFFNGWNHPQFGPPNAGLTPGQFGRISGLLINPRQVQFALRLVF